MLPHSFQVAWPSQYLLSSIALKELVPVVLVAAVWAHQWGGSFVLCHSDNTVVVSQINSLHSQDPMASNMLRCLACFQAHSNFWLRAVHIPGVENIGADDLFWNRAAVFLGRFSQASSSPSQVDQELSLLLCQEPVYWTSVSWREGSQVSGGGPGRVNQVGLQGRLEEVSCICPIHLNPCRTRDYRVCYPVCRLLGSRGPSHLHYRVLLSRITPRSSPRQSFMSRTFVALPSYENSTSRDSEESISAVIGSGSLPNHSLTYASH